MNWKEQLALFERDKEWDMAIQYMQHIITKYPDDVDAHLFMNYLLMNLLVEEDYNRSKRDFYVELCKNYFKESYKKFHENPEYLFFTGETAYMSEWYFDINLEEADAMLSKAMDLDPENMLYQWTYYINLDKKQKKNREQINHYARLVLEQNSPITTSLKEKGALGKCLYDMLIHWSKRMIQENSKVT